MIDTIVFDIVNVLANYNWREFMAQKGFHEEMALRVAKATLLSDDWWEYDHGTLSHKEIVDLFVENDPEIEKEIRYMNESLENLVTRRDTSIPWIQALKKEGYQVYFLSNYSEKAEAETREALDFIPYTDGGILSFKDQVYKPQPEIYRLLIERYQLQNRNCVFLDDTSQNLPPAEACGWKTILFKDSRQAAEELHRLGVKFDDSFLDSKKQHK